MSTKREQPYMTVAGLMQALLAQPPETPVIIQSGHDTGAPLDWIEQRRYAGRDRDHGDLYPSVDAVKAAEFLRTRGLDTSAPVPDSTPEHAIPVVVLSPRT